MSRYRTAEEIRDEYLSTLGPALGGAFHTPYNEVGWLHVKRRRFHTRLAGRPVHVQWRPALLDVSAPLFLRLRRRACGRTCLSTSAGSPTLRRRTLGGLRDGTAAERTRQMLARGGNSR